MTEFGPDPALDSIFYEDYNDESDDSANDSLNSEDVAGDESKNTDTEAATELDDQLKTKLSISEDHARMNYLTAGKEVLEEADGISVAGNSDHIDPDINETLDRIVKELSLPYQPSDFQRVSVNSVCQLNHLILISPTGSGKMDVPLLATLVLRERLGISKGVAIVTQPLTSIMNQKINNQICDVAVLSMSGELKGSSGRNEDADLSCEVSDLLEGKFPVLLGHPESFESPLGQSILRELQRLDRLVLVCIDEFHQGGLGKEIVLFEKVTKASKGGEGREEEHVEDEAGRNEQANCFLVCYILFIFLSMTSKRT